MAWIVIWQWLCSSPCHCFVFRSTIFPWLGSVEKEVFIVTQMTLYHDNDDQPGRWKVTSFSCIREKKWINICLDIKQNNMAWAIKSGKKKDQWKITFIGCNRYLTRRFKFACGLFSLTNKFTHLLYKNRLFVSIYVLQSRMNRWTNLHQILYRPPHHQGRFLIQPPVPRGSLKLQNLSRLLENQLCSTMSIRLMTFPITYVLPTMVRQIVDSPIAISSNVCLPNYLLLT